MRKPFYKVKAESHCSDNKNDTISRQRERILLVDLLHAEYAHAHQPIECVLFAS